MCLYHYRPSIMRPEEAEVEDTDVEMKDATIEQLAPANTTLTNENTVRFIDLLLSLSPQSFMMVSSTTNYAEVRNTLTILREMAMRRRFAISLALYTQNERLRIGLNTVTGSATTS